MEFKRYKRTDVAELRPVTERDIEVFRNASGKLLMADYKNANVIEVSISQSDILNGSPKLGDMIARNPDDHTDQWLVNEKYFNSKFKLDE